MTDQNYMERAIELASLGRGWTNPNPVVGAVIVKEGKIIGEGYHARYGELHAERNAFKALTQSACGATLYVTLEPCCHQGKTPPCTEAILEHGIARVVIGSRDPNPKVTGKGVERLRAAGVTVDADFMQEECDQLNPVFFHYITTGLPYVVMKYAMTADGRTATRKGASKWITGDAARELVQEMRHRYMGIMVGIGTVMADDPMLNVRLEGKKSPVRIICDSRLSIPEDSRICQTAEIYQTMIACGAITETGALPDGSLCASREKADRLQNLGIGVMELPDKNGKVDLRRLMRELGKKGIDSILLEGGGELNESALRAGIVQEVKAFVAPKLFGGRGAKAPVEGIGVSEPNHAVGLKLKSVRQIGEDLLLEYQVKGGNPCLQESWRSLEQSEV